MKTDMLHDNFLRKIEQETPEFIAIMTILTPANPFAEKGRKLLCIVNHIIDYYILREVESNNDIKMPIVYFPLCDEWAQVLCEEFVSIKMSLLWGEGTRTGLITSFKCKPYRFFPERANKKEQEAITKQFRFKRDVSRVMTEDVIGYPSKENEKCFLYSRYIANEHQLTSKTKGHYHFSYDLIGFTFSTEKSMILIGDSEKDVYDAIEKNDGKVKIPNVFLFLQKDLDGRNTKLCMQMQRSTINEYNEDYDAGIKNVFFFAFSQKPYRLQRIFETKHSLVERLQREKVAQTRDFISFTNDEMDYVFDRQQSDVHYINVPYDTDSEEHQFKLAFDLMMQDLPHEMKLRNELAICFTKRQQDLFKKDILEQNPEANEEYVLY